MFFKLFFGLVTSFLLTVVSCAGETQTSDSMLLFETFSQRVLAYYPKLKAAHSDVDIALAQQMRSKAGFWPSLDMSTGYQVSNDPVNVFGMLLRENRFTSSDFDLKRLNTPNRHQDMSAGLHVELPLFDALQTINRVRSARENLKASQTDEAFTKMEALLVAQDAYLNALTLDKLALIINEVQKSSDEDLQKAKELKDKGMILGADYYSARVMFGDFTRMKNEIASQRMAMTTLLNILMGESLDKVWILSDTIKEIEAPRQDQQKLMEAASMNRPDLSSLNARIQASGWELSREKASILPSLSAFGDVANDKDRVGESGGNNYTVGVKVDLPLFDPARQGRIQEARARKEQLERRVQILKDSVRQDIAQEIARYDTFRDNMTVLKGMNDDAKEAMSLAVPLYSEGRKSIADLLVIRRTYLQSAQEYNKALMGIWLSEARLLFLTGKLNEDEMKKLLPGA